MAFGVQGACTVPDEMPLPVATDIFLVIPLHHLCSYEPACLDLQSVIDGQVLSSISMILPWAPITPADPGPSEPSPARAA